MRIAMIDDNDDDRKMIRSFLERFFEESQDSFLIEEYDNALDFLEQYAFTYDFIIMDIDMPKLSGVDAAKELRKKDPNVTLMFVTNMPQYSMEGYSVEALDYVLKPLSYPDFRLKMLKAKRYIARNQDTKLTLHTTTDIIVVNASDIFYVESQLHYLYYHTKRGVYKVRGKLSEVEDILYPCHFARSGGSYLVNLSHLEKINGNELTIAGEVLPISRRMKPQLLETFTKYVGGMKGV